MTLTIAETAERAGRILDELERAVVGKRDVLELVLLGLLGDGHVLLDDVPGVAKTLTARSLARVTGPALLPHPVHPRPAARRHHRGGGARPGERRVRLPSRARCSPTSSSPTR